MSWLRSECLNFHSTLQALKMDVMYHKKLLKSIQKRQKHGHMAEQPHRIGTTEAELRAAANESKP